jgi:protein-S-isoprenylcysteine O-methyltransferase Ste14
MPRISATVISAVHFVLAPGIVVGLVPWLLTGWERRSSGPVHMWAGGILIVLGAVVLVHGFARFVMEGRGTPSPVAPTERLVVGGLYRYVRNPMYLAVIAAIIGQALVLGRSELLWYVVVVAAVVTLFTRAYEEPTLQHRFGASYDEYRRNVRGWWPRARPWRPAH